MITDIWIGKICLLIFIIIAAAEDFRLRSLDIRMLAAAFILEVSAYLYMLACGIYPDTVNILMGILIGAGIGLLSFISGESIGRGDALFFIISGIAGGWRFNIGLFISSITAVSIFALFLFAYEFINGRSARNMRIAFIPFTLPAGIYMLMT